MKENRLGPRQWAFVVVAGGAVCALPFTQSQNHPKPEPPVVDVEATLLPQANQLGLAGAASDAAVNPARPAAPNSAADIAAASASTTGLPSWPALPQSPFDELVQQKAIVPEAAPTEPIVPMQPLRPWISTPDSPKQPLANAQPNSNAGSLPAKSSLDAKPQAGDHLASAVVSTHRHIIRQQLRLGTLTPLIATRPANRFLSRTDKGGADYPWQPVLRINTPTKRSLRS